jgi:hypothetical protein
MIFTYFKAPPPPLRPGETADGTWHGFNRYAKPPTSKEICEFASVSFLALGPEIREDHWRIEKAGGVRLQSWRRVTGEEPACVGWEL